MELRAGAKILAEAVRGAEVPGADQGVQAELPIAELVPIAQMPLMPAEVLDALPDEGVERTQALRATGKGRPKGAINRATAEWRDFILSRYRSPLVVLAETYSRPAHDLAAEIGCTKLEAISTARCRSTSRSPATCRCW